MYAPLHQRFARYLVFALVGLLLLAPFLHGHIGASHQQGFHMDGLDVLEHVRASTPMESQAAPSWQADTAESMALGVASSLPKSDELPQAVTLGTALGLDAFLLALSAWAACLWARMRRRVDTPAYKSAASLTFAPGFPPPALAPPL